MQETIDLIDTLMQSRKTTLPKRLVAPGPDALQLQRILGAAAHAPDHGQLMPWRFVIISEAARPALGEAFAEALLERDASALPEQVQQAREKALRAPLLMLLLVKDKSGDVSIDFAERVLSAGCAVQNMLLMATALGFCSALTSGKALKSTQLRSLFSLGTNEHALCFVSVGSAGRNKQARVRPVAEQYVSTLSLEDQGNGP
jgi:nitroreductase